MGLLETELTFRHTAEEEDRLAWYTFDDVSPTTSPTSSGWRIKKKRISLQRAFDICLKSPPPLEEEPPEQEEASWSYRCCRLDSLTLFSEISLLLLFSWWGLVLFNTPASLTLHATLALIQTFPRDRQGLHVLCESRQPPTRLTNLYREETQRPWRKSLLRVKPKTSTVSIIYPISTVNWISSTEETNKSRSQTDGVDLIENLAVISYYSLLGCLLQCSSSWHAINS